MCVDVSLSSESPTDTSPKSVKKELQSPKTETESETFGLTDAEPEVKKYVVPEMKHVMYNCGNRTR